MKILLVQPPLDPITSVISKIGLAEPLGLEYLAAAIPDHDVRILDLRVAGSLDTALDDFDPQIIGVTSLTPTASEALGLLHSAKLKNPDLVTMIGGFHATLLPEDCFRDFVDVVVPGDGENALREIIAALETGKPLATVPGIIFQQDGEFIRNSPRPLPDINTYDAPARHLTEEYRSAYHRVGLGPIVSALTSRGCSRRCSFCAAWRFHGGKYRLRNPEKIVEELATRPETAIDFADDDSFGDLKRMEILARLYREYLPNRICRFYARVDSVVKAPRLFETWAEAGMRYVLVGLEAFTENELKGMNKSASVNDNHEALRILKSLGVRVLGCMIVHPDYTRDDFRRLRDTVARLEIAQPYFTSITPYPGTTLFEQWKDRLLTTDWRFYNAFHCVVDTVLPRPEYYNELAQLYGSAAENHNGSMSPSEVSLYNNITEAVRALGELENDVPTVPHANTVH